MVTKADTPAEAPQGASADAAPAADAAPMAPESGSPAASHQGAPENEPLAAEVNNAIDVMRETDPAKHLEDFLGGQGLPLDALDAAPQNPNPTPAVQPGNAGAPSPAPNGASSPQPGQPGAQPDPLLARLFSTPPVTPSPVPGAVPAWAQQPVQPQPQPQPQGQPQGQPTGQDDVLFTQAFALPPQIQQALDHDDPAVRANAIGATIAAAGNVIYKQVRDRFQAEMAQMAPRVAADVSVQQFRERVTGDLFGQFPQLRYAAPQLLQQAAQVVLQDEMSRNPNVTYSPQLMARIGQLAQQALTAMAGGQVPQFQPQPQPQVQAQPGYSPMPVQPGYPPYPQPQPGMYPQPAQAPWMAGQTAAPFGAPPAVAPTPESEFAWFMNNGAQ